MLITIHGLPPNMRYTDIKALLKDKCNLTEIILDNLNSEGATKKVTVGVPDHGDAAILVRKINGLYLNSYQLYIEDVRNKHASEQPYRSSSYSQPEAAPQITMQQQAMMQQMISQAAMARMYAAQTCKEPQQAMVGNQNYYQAQGFFPQPLPPQDYNQASTPNTRGVDQGFGVQKYDSGNGNYAQAGPSFESSNHGYDRNNQGYDRSNQAQERSNQSFDRSNQGYDRSNQAHERSNQAHERSNQGYDRSNQVQERGNQSYDFSNDDYDSINQGFDGSRGYQSLDSNRSQPGYGEGNYDQFGPNHHGGQNNALNRPRDERFKRSGSPNFGKSRSGPNLRPDVQTGPYGNGDTVPKRKRSASRRQEFAKKPAKGIPQFSAGYQAPRYGPGNQGQSTSGFVQGENLQVRPQAPLLGSGPNTGPRFGQSGPNYGNNTQNYGPNDSRFHGPPKGPKNFAPNRQNNAFKQNGPPAKQAPPNMTKKGKQKGTVPKPMLQDRPVFSKENLLKCKSKYEPTQEDLKKINIWVAQTVGSVIKDYRRYKPKRLTNEVVKILKQKVQPKVAMLAENNPPDSYNKMYATYRFWFPKYMDLPYLNRCLAMIERGSLVYQKTDDKPSKKKNMKIAPANVDEPDYNLPIELNRNNKMATPRLHNILPEVAGTPDAEKIVRKLLVIPPEELQDTRPTGHKRIFKDLKKVRVYELAHDNFYPLPTPLKEAFDEEFESINKIMLEECNDTNDEVSFLNFFTNNMLPEFNKVVRLEVTKRLLKIGSGLTLRVYFDPKSLPKTKLRAYLDQNGIIAARAVDKCLYWLAHCKDHETFDKLIALESVVVDGVTVKFKALKLVQPNKKENLSKKKKKQLMQGSVLKKPTGKNISGDKSDDSFDSSGDEEPNIEWDKQTTNQVATLKQETFTNKNEPGTSNLEDSKHDVKMTNQIKAENEVKANIIVEKAATNKISETSAKIKSATTKVEPNKSMQDDGDDKFNQNIDDSAIVDEFLDDENVQADDLKMIDDADVIEMEEDDLEEFDLHLG